MYSILTPNYGKKSKYKNLQNIKGGFDWCLLLIGVTDTENNASPL